MSTRQRLKRLEDATDTGGVIVTKVRAGQSNEDAWREQHGDLTAPRGTVCVFLQGFAGGPIDDPA